MKSPRSPEQVLDFSLSVDGGVISPEGFEWPQSLDSVREVFVRIHPVITGKSSKKGNSGFRQGFLLKDQRFVLKSIKDEGGGVARIHYIRSPKKQVKGD
jgi:hypothetical protein